MSAAPPSDEAKYFADCQALAALQGISVTVMPGDDGRPAYLVSWGALTRQLDSPIKLGVWLWKAGVDVAPPPGLAEATRAVFDPVLSEVRESAQLSVDIATGKAGDH